MRLRLLLALSSLTVCVAVLGDSSPGCQAHSVAISRVNVHLVTDEADAVLAILAKRRANQVLTQEDWDRLFSSEGYRRLKRRETSMQRSFTDDEFKSFILSDKLLANAKALAVTLGRWRQANVGRAAERALAYLPKEAHIQAKIYPVIKPRENSFVFEVNTDPAIFLYLDPVKSKEQFENTLAHELHHIGYGSSCPPSRIKAEIARAPENVRLVTDWIDGFGEGFAMLAAAGGPDIHPHKYSKPEDRARWDRDMANYNSDLKKVQQFFLDILSNKLSEEERTKQGFSFFGVQGPWYTVGWKMAVVIEKRYGRARLIECICDQRKLLSTYNRAAARHNRNSRVPLAIWSATVIDKVRKTYR